MKDGFDRYKHKPRFVIAASLKPIQHFLESNT